MTAGPHAFIIVYLFYVYTVNFDILHSAGELMAEVCVLG